MLARDEIRLRGEHNVANVLSAVAVASRVMSGGDGDSESMTCTTAANAHYCRV